MKTNEDDASTPDDLHGLYSYLNLDDSKSSPRKDGKTQTIKTTGVRSSMSPTQTSMSPPMSQSPTIKIETDSTGPGTLGTQESNQDVNQSGNTAQNTSKTQLNTNPKP